MKTLVSVALVILCFTCCGYCDKDVAFIGLTGAQAPSIEKTFNRHFLEYLAIMPQVHSLNTMEIANLRERTSGNFSITSMTPAFFASLKRFATDSTLVIWGRVKECTVRPERFWVVGAGIRGRLTIELTMYNLSDQQFSYIGDASATTLEKKGFVLWGPVEKAIQISAQERAQVIDELELKGVTASGRILSTIMFTESSQKDKKSSAFRKDSLKDGSPMLGKKHPPRDSLNEEPPYVPEEPSKIIAVDSTVVDSTKRK